MRRGEGFFFTRGDGKTLIPLKQFTKNAPPNTCPMSYGQHKRRLGEVILTLGGLYYHKDLLDLVTLPNHWLFWV
jgi:hypothetical protein